MYDVIARLANNFLKLSVNYYGYEDNWRSKKLNELDLKKIDLLYYKLYDAIYNLYYKYFVYDDDIGYDPFNNYNTDNIVDIAAKIYLGDINYNGFLMDLKNILKEEDENKFRDFLNENGDLHSYPQIYKQLHYGISPVAQNVPNEVLKLLIEYRLEDFISSYEYWKFLLNYFTINDCVSLIQEMNRNNVVFTDKVLNSFKYFCENFNVNIDFLKKFIPVFNVSIGDNLLLNKNIEYYINALNSFYKYKKVKNDIMIDDTYGVSSEISPNVSIKKDIVNMFPEFKTYLQSLNIKKWFFKLKEEDVVFIASLITKIKSKFYLYWINGVNDDLIEKILTPKMVRIILNKKEIIKKLNNMYDFGLLLSVLNSNNCLVYLNKLEKPEVYNFIHSLHYDDKLFVLRYNLSSAVNRSLLKSYSLLLQFDFELQQKVKKEFNRFLSTESVSFLFEKVKDNKSFPSELKENYRKIENIINIQSIVNNEEVQEYLDSGNVKKHPMIESIKYKIGNLTFESLPADSTEYFSVGANTNCCQYVGGVGEDAAIDSFINPEAGVLVLKDDNEQIIAQSYFHYVPKDNGFILDNVEVSKLAHKYDLDTIYANIANKIKEDYDVNYVRCGKGYNKLNNHNFEQSSLEKDNRSFKSKNVYTDFDYKSNISLLNPRFEVKKMKVINV